MCITNQIYVSKPKSLQKKISNNIEIYGINSLSAFKNGQSALFSEKKVNEQDSLVYFHEQFWQILPMYARSWIGIRTHRSMYTLQRINNEFVQRVSKKKTSAGKMAI